MDEKEIDHLAGGKVVVKHFYLNQRRDGTDVFTSLPDELAEELWQDAAFTNGGPLVKIEILWAPEERAKIEDQISAQEDDEEDAAE